MYNAGGDVASDLFGCLRHRRRHALFNIDRSLRVVKRSVHHAGHHVWKPVYDAPPYAGLLLPVVVLIRVAVIRSGMIRLVGVMWMCCAVLSKRRAMIRRRMLTGAVIGAAGRTRVERCGRGSMSAGWQGYAVGTDGSSGCRTAQRIRLAQAIGGR